MNFDNLKSAWEQDKTEQQYLSISDIYIGRSTTVVGKIRRNMKKEFLFQFSCYLLLLLIFFLWIKNPITEPIMTVITFILLMQSGYYTYRFYYFFKSIGRADLGIKKNIRHIIYELEINMDAYKIYTFCTFPLVSLFFLAIVADRSISSYIQEVITSEVWQIGPLLLFMLLMMLLQVIFYFFIKEHLNFQYGRYLRELKKIWEDLETA